MRIHKCGAEELWLGPLCPSHTYPASSCETSKRVLHPPQSAVTRTFQQHRQPNLPQLQMSTDAPEEIPPPQFPLTMIMQACRLGGRAHAFARHLGACSRCAARSHAAQQQEQPSRRGTPPVATGSHEELRLHTAEVRKPAWCHFFFKLYSSRYG